MQGDGTTTGAGGGTGAAAGGASGGTGGGDFSGMSDGDVLERAGTDSGGSGGGAGGAQDQGAAAAAVAGKDKTAAPGAAASEEVNLAALGDEAAPEWLAKITDETAKGEVTKLLDLNKAFTQRFKDAADLETFFKDLPGGREQITAMQTLAREVGELDSFIEGNDPAGHAQVAERVFEQAPQNAGPMLRAFSQTFAKKDPEGYNQIAGELIDSTLKAAGIGTNFADLRQAIGDIKTALQKDDAEGMGRALSKLIADPKQDRQEDPNVVRAREAEKNARTAERGAKVQTWENQVQKNGEAIEHHVRTSIGKALAAKDSQGRPLLPASIPEKDRNNLTDAIMAEIDSQVGADKWLGSQIFQLVGSRANDKHNLGASAKEFGEALNLSKAAVDRVMTAAVRKVVSQWARDLAASNGEARQRARGGTEATRKDVGGSSAVHRNGRPTLTMDDVSKLSDAEILDKATGLN